MDWFCYLGLISSVVNRLRCLVGWFGVVFFHNRLVRPGSIQTAGCSNPDSRPPSTSSLRLPVRRRRGLVLAHLAGAAASYSSLCHSPTAADDVRVPQLLVTSLAGGHSHGSRGEGLEERLPCARRAGDGAAAAAAGRPRRGAAEGGEEQGQQALEYLLHPEIVASQCSRAEIRSELPLLPPPDFCTAPYFGRLT